MFLFNKRKQPETANATIPASGEAPTVSGISALANVENTTYKIGGKTLPSHVYDSSNVGHTTGLHQAVSASGTVYPAYCVDITKLIDHDVDYTLATDAQIEQLFPAWYVKRLRWIMNHTYPLITDMSYLDSISGASGLTPQDAVNGTQGAIWAFTNSSSFDFGREGTSNNSNVIRLYDYLYNYSLPGWDLADVKNYGDSISLSFDVSAMKQFVLNGKYLYGPIRLRSNSYFAKNTPFSLTASRGSVQFCNENGVQIFSAELDEAFYIDAPKAEQIGSLMLNAAGNIIYGADYHIIMCENGKDASQTCGFLEFLSKDLSAHTNLCLCKLIIRKIGNGDCCDFLTGAVFELYSPEGVLLDTKTSDEAGMIYFYNLLPGNYLLKEIKAPEGFVLPEDPFSVSIKCPYKVFTVDNQKKKCRIKVIKYDKHNPDIRLAGAEFEIYDSKKQLVGHIITNKDGIAVSDKLPDGEYFLTEVKAPADYLFDSSPIKVTLSAKGGCPDGYHVIHVCNVKFDKKGKIKIIKYSKECEEIRLSDAVFEIRNEKGDIVDTLITCKKGEAISKELPFGKYTLVEVKAPHGYLPNPKPIEIDLKEEFIVIRIKNKKKPCECEDKC